VCSGEEGAGVGSKPALCPAHNSEYLVPLRSTQITSGRKLPTATSGIRGTPCYSKDIK